MPNTTTFYHAKNPIAVRTKANTQTSLVDICKSVTPPCHLSPFLFNGHLQTCWTAVDTTDIPVYYKRKIFTADDNSYHGTFAVDFAVDEYQWISDGTLPPRTSFFSDAEATELELGSLDNRPMLITLHGLSGGSHEIYLRHVIAPMVSKDRGWAACVVNSRGCAMSKITSPVLFNARATWDLRQVVKWLKEKYPNRPLFAIGYSLGANILTNYLGEEGPDCILKAAIVCGSPWNLEVSSLALKRTWVGLGVYSRVMGSNMKKLFELEVQCPAWGYPTESAYYRDASSSDSVLAVRTPLFVIQAEDDPIAPKEAIPFEEIEQNPYVVLCTTSGGGHLSWYKLGGERWFTKPVTGFLTKMAEAKAVPTSDHSAPSTSDSDNAEPDGIKIFGFSPMRRKLQIENIIG